MRLSLWLLCSPLLAGLVLCRPIEYSRTAVRDTRDLLGLLGEDANVPANTVTPTATSVQTITPTSTTIATGEPHIPPTPTHVRMTAASAITSSASPHEITSPLASDSVTSSVYLSPGASTSLIITSFAPGVLEDASTTPPAELKQWKVIGIAVITVTFIALVAMAISFFDSWWGFVRAAICGKARKIGHGGETMIPDWEKRSWELQLANEDGHRYPTMASLESIVKEKEKAHELGVEGRGTVSPNVAYGW
ncbi:hypothetical protein CVT25_002687 [Psilocybe cyanescens]|uniref:Uncharacterized protein n=1 Tax=Psilocybe cyanescens TaxID=93625 RepID=A0A409WLL8_PSICY|nr:hypothetical protein CVT25_002687 [Psilocybe cyanescens]